MEIRPFRGIRYALDPGRHISPPYDVIDDDMRAKLVVKSEHNIVRVIKGERAAGDSAYGAIGELVARWLADGVLAADSQPSYYVYSQAFTIGDERYERLALIGAVKLVEYGEGMHAHERTLEGPKADRLELMRATRLNDGLIFVLYDDPEQTVDTLLSEATAGEALVDVEVEGMTHRLYRIAETAKHDTIAATLADKQLFIADGHHRYETALNFMHERPDLPAAQYRMMSLVNFRCPGLVILPTHRLLHDIPDFDGIRLRQELEADFVVERLDGLDQARDRLAARHRDAMPAFVMVLAGGQYDLLTFRDVEAAVASLPHERSEAWRRLDVPLLHATIFERRLGITHEMEASESCITYVKDSAKAVPHAVACVDRGECQALFLMNATRLDELREVAAHNEKMPQKSTYFYPKMWTGLVLRSLEALD